MRTLWAVLLAAGVLLALGPRGTRAPRASRPRFDRRLVVLGASGALGVGAIVFVLVGIPAVAFLAAVGGAVVPALHRRAQRARRDAARRAVWPEAVELLAGSMRAGETIVGSLAVVADRGPEALRGFFAEVVADHRVGGDLVGALGRAAHGIEDPIADRVVATLALIHRVGGRESARVLRTLASFLRDDLALRREVAARQSWTKVAARVAVASPWLVVLLVGFRAEGRSAYSTGPGAVVLLIGAAVSAVGYLLMARLGRVPEPPRCVTVGV